MIPHAEWKWHGMPGHLIVSASCCFHLVTDIGSVRVSTIGCYHKPGDPKDYEHRCEIGSGRLYETFVFTLSPGGVASGAEAQPPLSSLTEIDVDFANNEAEAEAAHLRMCEKWAARDGLPPEVSDE